jgi:hypothetical protein
LYYLNKDTWRTLPDIKKITNCKKLTLLRFS